MINDLNLDFNFLGISEFRILEFQSFNINISLKNYLIEQTPSESTAGEILLYINRKHSYKTCPDLMINKSKKLESTFIEVILPYKSNLIIECIYRHPCMDICTFNDHYLNPLLKKLSKLPTYLLTITIMCSKTN